MNYMEFIFKHKFNKKKKAKIKQKSTRAKGRLKV